MNTVTAKCFECDWGMTHSPDIIREVVSDHLQTCHGPVMVHGRMAEKPFAARWTVFEGGYAAGGGSMALDLETVKSGWLKPEVSHE